MKKEGAALPVMESFYTIQGEGAYTGTPAYFIRLGGCDVGCVWCDVKDSWDVNAHLRIPVSELAKRAAESGTSIAVVTGGEPAMHDLTLLTAELKSRGLRTHIETSGVYPLTGQWDWITFSPKKFKVPDASVYPVASELKIIVFHKSDLQWAKEYAEKVSASCNLFLQPEWDKRGKMIPLIFDFVLKNPVWRISLQTHKYIGVD